MNDYIAIITPKDSNESETFTVKLGEYNKQNQKERCSLFEKLFRCKIICITLAIIFFVIGLFFGVGINNKELIETSVVTRNFDCIPEKISCNNYYDYNFFHFFYKPSESVKTIKIYSHLFIFILLILILIIIIIFLLKNDVFIRFRKIKELNSIKDKVLSDSFEESFDKTEIHSRYDDRIIKKSNQVSIIKHYITCITEL